MKLIVCMKQMVQQKICLAQQTILLVVYQSNFFVGTTKFLMPQLNSFPSLGFQNIYVDYFITLKFLTDLSITLQKARMSEDTMMSNRRSTLLEEINFSRGTLR